MGGYRRARLKSFAHLPRHRDFAHLLQNREDFAHLPTQFVITFPVPLPGSPRQQTPSSKADCPTRAIVVFVQRRKHGGDERCDEK